MRTLASIIVLAATSLPVGCGGGGASGAFNPTFPDNREEQLAEVARRAAAAPARDDAPVLAGVDESGGVFAYDVANGRELWSRDGSSRTLPWVAGDLVISHEDRGIVARDLSSGAEAFVEDDEALHLVGADGDGTFGVAVLSTGGGVGAHSRLLVTRDGSLAWDADIDHALGAPAVLGGMLFLPWGNQNLSVLDAASGEEIARLRMADAVLATARASEGAVWAGQTAVVRMDGAATRGTREQTTSFSPELGDLPGNPAFMPDAYQPPPAPDSALHRIRITFRPRGEAGAAEMADGLVYVVFYKMVFAMNASGEGARWVRLLDDDVVGASAQPGGVLVADSAGGLAFLNAGDGRSTWTAETGHAARSVRLRAGDFAPGGSPTGDELPLRDQLLTAASSTDARLVPGRSLAVRMLAAIAEPEVTANLIALCDDDALPADVRTGACEALAERTEGAEHVLSALTRHAGFLRQTTAPPVGPLASAAVRMEARAAVPHLLTHLKDPATPTDHLPALLNALRELGDDSAAEPVRAFLRLYHSDDAAEAMVAALGAAIDALVALQGPVARETLEEVANDALGIGAVRGKAQQAIAALEEQAAEAEQVDREREEAESGEASDADGSTEEAEAEAPEHITRAIADRILGPVQRQLRTCLADAEGRPRSARAIVRLDGTGNIERVSVTPDAVQACVEPLIRSQSWPANRGRSREQVIYTIRR